MSEPYSAATAPYIAYPQPGAPPHDAYPPTAPVQALPTAADTETDEPSSVQSLLAALSPPPRLATDTAGAVKGVLRPKPKTHRPGGTPAEVPHQPARPSSVSFASPVDNAAPPSPASSDAAPLPQPPAPAPSTGVARPGILRPSSRVDAAAAPAGADGADTVVCKKAAAVRKRAAELNAGVPAPAELMLAARRLHSTSARDVTLWRLLDRALWHAGPEEAVLTADAGGADIACPRYGEFARAAGYWMARHGLPAASRMHDARDVFRRLMLLYLGMEKGLENVDRLVKKADVPLVSAELCTKDEAEAEAEAEPEITVPKLDAVWWAV